MISEFLPLSVYPDYRSSRLSRKNGTKRVTWSYWEVSISTKICLFLWSWVNPFQSPSNPLFSRKPCTTSRTTVISPLECSAAPPLVCSILALTLGCFQRSLKIGLTSTGIQVRQKKTWAEDGYKHALAIVTASGEGKQGLAGIQAEGSRI